MGTIYYTHYSDSDAADVVSLLKRNNFYLARFDKDLNESSFIMYQRMRGLLFAVVARDANGIVGHVGAYRTGCQRVAKPHQVYVSSMLIDKKYRSSLYSIREMITLLFSEVVSRGYTEMVSEVASYNTTSLKTLRRFNYMRFSAEPDLYGNTQLHNYTPGLWYLFGTEMDSADLMASIPRSRLSEVDEVLDGNLCTQDYVTKGFGRVSVTFSRDSGYPIGVVLSDFNLSIHPDDQTRRGLIITNTSKATRRLVLSVGNDSRLYYLQGGDIVRVLASPTDRASIGIEEIDAVLTFDLTKCFSSKDLDDFYLFGAGMPKRMLDLSTGFLIFQHGASALLREMWPCIMPPYLSGCIIPERRHRFSISRESANSFMIVEDSDEAALHRHYEFTEHETVIHTWARVSSAVRPIFHVALDDLTYRCLVQTATISVEKHYDFSSTDVCTEELLYVNFEQEEYSRIPFKRIEIRTEKGDFEILSEKPCRCFVHFNYIGFEFLDQSLSENGWVVSDGNVDFGRLFIRSLSVES